MSTFSTLRYIILALVLLGCLAPPAPVRGQSGGPTMAGVPMISPETLPRILQEANGALQEKIKALESRVEQTRERVAGVQTELENLQVSVAAAKAALAVQGLPLSQAPEVLGTFSQQQARIKNQAKEVSQDIEDLLKTRAAEIASQNTLRAQVGIIQARVKPLPAELSPVYVQYLQLADQEDRLLDQVLANLQQEGQLLAGQEALLAGLLPQLQALEENWKAELLKRPTQSIPLQEQMARIWSSVAALPARLWEGLAGLVASGLVVAFFWSQLTHLLGLLGLIIILAWGTRRLSRAVAHRFQTWKARSTDLDLLPLYLLGNILFAHLPLLALIFWAGLFLWIFGLWDFQVAQLFLSGLFGLWVLRLGLQGVQSFFAGKSAGGVLPLDSLTARFYRRSLKLLLLFLFLGIFILRSAAFLGFAETSRLFLEHLFQVAVIIWSLWLLRRPHLTHLLPVLQDPTWLHRPVYANILRAVGFSLLSAIVLADLLDFQNLARYLAQAATWTLLALVVFWLLWLVADRLVFHILHPETGRIGRRFPEKHKLVTRVYAFGRGALAVVLGGAVVFGSLSAWGIKPGQVAWGFRWLTWGPDLGPVRLNTLNLGGAFLALYLGFWLSQILRSLMMVRIFPRTGFDSGVQYTISTTLHYVILFLAILIALNILGFPLTNLALVAGALGVGIGFGLQNIVNNFFSGLILLFERPIKVGDILVIDGQWGTVKEIRVRSTVFETFDRYVLIVPNSELVSQKVLNWTHYGRGINRINLKVGVGYDSDPRLVTQLLTELCLANPRVAPEPPPQVYFSVYGDSSLDFTIWVHVKTPADRMPATHELNTAILEAFKGRGIEMPFPQRDLHLKDWPPEWPKPPEGVAKKGNAEESGSEQ